ncbi:hypothetical protein [Nioella nitratireducens]|uniref:hypothetical protein n=1 Tax=Nioella nitratireducens TaxID=1287720 RepID=UPI0008FD59F1|nr:hypothetical protein [Nioella nitratireducens]
MFGFLLGLGGCGIAFQQCDDPALTLDNAALAVPGVEADCRAVENLGEGIYRLQCDGNRTGFVVR